MNQSSQTMNKTKLAEMVAKLRAAKQQGADGFTDTMASLSSLSSSTTPSGTQTDKHGKTISYNTKQQEFVTLASSGASSVLIGAAGTGKTTCMKGTVEALIQNGIVGILDSGGHKHLQSGTPGIVICAYTRRAVNNIRKNLSADVQTNCITIHKLLEYAPEYYDVTDEATGESKTTMKFSPSRNSANPLPSTIRTIIFEESSMIGTDLYKEVIDACPHSPQLIFLGDIQQLPPVFGPAILGFKLLSLPVVELTEVYRQALESPIISLAHRILSGNPIPVSEYPNFKIPEQLTIHPWKKKISAQDALYTSGQFFISAELKGIYNPEEDMILLPFNKGCGTLELNKIIANHLSKKRGVDVYEVVAGFNKHYFSVGDKVLFEKEDAEIVSILPNPSYSGVKAQQHSPTLDYWGHDPIIRKESTDDQDIDDLLAHVAKADEDRVRESSHSITLRMVNSDNLVTTQKAAEVNAMLLGYCLTVHKSQGSEWRKVFFVCHQSHATMLQRELLYTAVTRAKEELYIICEPETFTNGILSQRVRGDTLAEKAQFFKGKIQEGVNYE